jgi:hypothetical protein
VKNLEINARIFSEQWSRTSSEQVLDIILEALVQIDLLWLRLNPGTPVLYKSGVRYYHDGSREEWLAIPEVLHEMVADCKSLAAWLVAEYRFNGTDPGARCCKDFSVVKTKFGDLLLYHIRVERSNGVIEDPSKELGMHKPEPDGYIPVPGVPWVIVNGLTSAIGAGMSGNAEAIAQLDELRRHAEEGDAVARYLVEVARTIREKGYDPNKREWKRLPDGRWDWLYPGAV